MKKIALSQFTLAVVLCITSCNDETKPALPKETVLSKVFQDNKLELEYQYNSNKQLEQIRDFELLTGQLNYFSKFEYDTRGFLQNLTSYDASGKATSTSQYLKDSDGKFISSEFITLIGADSGKVVHRHKYQYNKAGHISKQAWHNADTDAEESYTAFFYYPSGNLERYEYYWTVNPSPKKSYEVRYVPDGQPLPESISERRGYPINFDLFRLVADKIEYELFDTALGTTSEYQEVISNRIYNSRGFITEQTITYKYILPEKPDKVINMKYEYIEI